MAVAPHAPQSTENYLPLHPIRPTQWWMACRTWPLSWWQILPNSNFAISVYSRESLQTSGQNIGRYWLFQKGPVELERVSYPLHTHIKLWNSRSQFMKQLIFCSSIQSCPHKERWFVLVSRSTPFRFTYRMSLTYPVGSNRLGFEKISRKYPDAVFAFFFHRVLTYLSIIFIVGMSSAWDI